MDTPDVKVNTEDDPMAIPDIFKRKPGDKPKDSVKSKPKAKPVASKANGKAKTAAKAPVSAPVSAEPEPAKGKAPAKAKAKPAAAKTAKPKAKPKRSPLPPEHFVEKTKAKIDKKTKPVKKPEVKTKKPSKDVELDKFSFKIGTIKSKAASMYARKSGASTEEVEEEFNGAQLNLLKEAAERGHTVKKEKTQRKDGRSVTRYYLSE